MVKRRKKSLFSILFALVRRTLLRSPMQFLAVILITGIATTLYVGLTSNALSLSNRVNALYEGANIADLWTTVSKYDKQDLTKINDLLGEGAITEERFSLSATLNSYSATALLSKELPAINKAYLTDNNDEENYFIIDQRLLEAESATNSTISWHDKNGEYDTVPVDFAFSTYRNAFNKSTLITLPNAGKKTFMDLFNTCLKDDGINIFDNAYLHGEFEITGTMMGGENVQSSLMNNTSFLMSRNLFVDFFTQQFNENFITPEAVDSTDENYEWISFIRDLDLLNMAKDMVFNQFSVNQYVSKLGKGVSVDTAKNRINNYFAAKPNSNLIICVDINNLTSNVTIQSDIIQAQQLSYIFPMIFFIVAILVVLTTLSQLIIKDRTQIGTMKALGISKGRVIFHYILLDATIVLIGILAGIILGPFILPFIMDQKYAILYSLPRMTYTLALPEALLVTLVLLAISSIVTLAIVFGEVRLNPSQSMRPKAAKNFKKHTKSISKTRKPFMVSVKMAFRNIRVNLIKSLMVIVGVMGCTGLLVCGFGIDDTLNYGVDKDINNFFSSDVMCYYSSTSSMKDEISLVDGVNSVEELAILPVNVYTDKSTYATTIMVIDDNSKNFMGDGKYFPDNMAGISSKKAREFGLSIGDDVKFTLLGNTYNITIGFIMDAFYQHNIYLNVKDFPDLAEYKNAAWVNISDGYDITIVKDEISKIGGVSSARTNQETKEMVASYMSSISLMTLAVKVFAIALAVVVLYNLALLNFKEKIRDIATLKVLGFSKLEIAYSLILEIMFLTMLGIAFGLLIGKPLEILVLFVNQTPVVDFLYTVFLATYIISFLISFLTAFVVNIFLTHKLKSVKMVESLKSIE